MKKNQLSIRLYGEPIGILEQTPSGKMAFSYHKEATMPVSIGMPIREQPYGDESCEAFFGGLLPESDVTKQKIAQHYGINGKNNFALLRAIGYDCAGAISCFEIDTPVISQHTFPLTGRILSDTELYKNIKDLPKKPLFMGIEDLRLSLAGVHDKAAICLIDNQIAIPEKGCPSTHILKASSQDLEGLIENEYFCLQLAEKVGLPIPRHEIRIIKDISYLLIERYDRRVIQNNLVERIHQEDFCQAHGVPSIYKYQSDGGPGFQKCFHLLDGVNQPAIDRNRLASAMVFNFLIGNMDAHSKNFSLLQYKPAQFELAPFYDLVCTRVYPALSSKMAMKISSKYAVNEVLPRHWEQLCQEIRYSFPALKALISQQGEVLLSSMDWSKQFCNDHTQKSPIIHQITEIVKRQINKTLERFEKIL